MNSEKIYVRDFMNIERFEVGPLLTNCYLAVCEITGESVLIDPGSISRKLEESIKNSQLKVILLTHGHFDHIGGLNEILKFIKAPVLIHKLDAPMLTDPLLNASYMMGIEYRTVEASSLLSHGDTITCGESILNVLHTPGHTQGSVSFAVNDEFVIAGDTLFKQSVGRWDLPGGDYTTLMESIRNTFLPMPDATNVYPGHGEPTTIGFERRNNQFIAV